MTSATRATAPLTEDQCLAILTDWAADYPSARFMVVTMAPDGSDAEQLGWGLALPDHVFTYLPALNFTGQFRSADRLTRTLGRSLDIRLIWVDPEPQPWPED